MAYNDFLLDRVCKTFGLAPAWEALFDHIPAVQVPQWLQDLLDKTMPLALGGSEKARSEFIVVPILVGSRELSQNSFYVYSGQRLDVDPAQGLVGECDFILADTRPLPVLQAPIMMLVEAKKHDIDAGIGQCAAQMVGARLFNQREGKGPDTIFGCVTSGENWQFLKLEHDSLIIDSHRYYIVNVDQVLGVFQAIVAYPRKNVPVQ
jgi:hypothetical protein